MTTTEKQALFDHLNEIDAEIAETQGTCVISIRADAKLQQCRYRLQLLLAGLLAGE